MSEQRLDIRGALGAGWNLTKGRPGLWLGYFGVLVGIGVFQFGLQTGLSAVLPSSNQWVALSVSLGTGLPFQLVKWFLAFNAIGMAVRLVDGKDNVRFGDLFVLQAGHGWYFLATLLFGLAVFGGIILLLIPGVIFSLMFMFYGYVLNEQDLDSIEALKASAGLTRGHKGRLFLFVLATLGVNLLGALCVLLGLLVTVPLTFFATAHIYRQLTRLSPAAS